MKREDMWEEEETWILKKSKSNVDDIFLAAALKQVEQQMSKFFFNEEIVFPFMAMGIFRFVWPK